jgi:arylsulfatase A-like enzyme
MKLRLVLFMLGVCPILFVDLAFVIPGTAAGATFQSALMLGFLCLLGLGFLIVEPLMRPLVPKGMKGSPMCALAMGLSLLVLGTLPHLLPTRLEAPLNNNFLVATLYLLVGVTVSYAAIIRVLENRKVPAKAGISLLILIGAQLPLAAYLEYSQEARYDEEPFAWSETQELAPRRPNVLLIVLDTLRYDTLHTEWMGQKHFPALDEITKDAAIYEGGYAGSNVTPGGHTTLLTGFYPAETGTLALGLVSLDEQYLTVTEFLRGYGYRTAATISNARVSGRFGYRQGFEIYDDSLVNPEFDLKNLGERFSFSSMVQLFGAPYSRKIVTAAFKQANNQMHGLPAAGDTSRSALNAMDALEIQDGEPWFLFLNYIDPHTPYVTRPDLAKAFGPGFKSEELEGVQVSVTKFHDHMKSVAADLKAGKDRSKDLLWLQEIYREQCLELDEGVEELLDGLTKRGLLDDNTLILITSDHGEHLGEHDAFHHGSTLLDEEVRVPFLLMGPGVNPGRISTPVSGVDFLSTVCYAMGLEEEDYPDSMGIPLQTPVEGRVIRFEHGELRGFLVDHVKMIARDRDGELTWEAAYDLRKDPKELDNLIDSGLEWVEALIANPPIQSSEDAGKIVAGDGSIDLGALGYADEEMK